MNNRPKVVVTGAGNAALCAGIAALESDAEVIIVEKAPEEEAGGNTRYTAGAMRFEYNSKEDLLPLLLDASDPKIELTDFGSYTKEQFAKDLIKFNEGKPLTLHQKILIENSYETLLWLSKNNIRFEPIYERQSYKKDGRYIFWGGLTLASRGEGDGLFKDELKRFLELGGRVIYDTEGHRVVMKDEKVVGLECLREDGQKDVLEADALILGSGGFESSKEKRVKYLGTNWAKAKVRGTPHNTGGGIDMAIEAGAALNGIRDGCHAVPMDLHMPEYGNTQIPYIDRKNYRKICYFLGVMLNAKGNRFVDEGRDFRNYTYAQFGKAIIEQPGQFAWQIFDSKIEEYLYKEYSFYDAHYVEADTLEDLVKKLEGVDKERALKTLYEYNEAVMDDVKFDPTELDGKGTVGILPKKSNWANKLDRGPYKAFPCGCGITFSYYGVLVDEDGAVLRDDGSVIEGLYACGEMVGGVFLYGYPGGSGLTSGAVFGRLAGLRAGRS